MGCFQSIIMRFCPLSQRSCGRWILHNNPPLIGSFYGTALSNGGHLSVTHTQFFLLLLIRKSFHGTNPSIFFSDGAQLNCSHVSCLLCNSAVIATPLKYYFTCVWAPSSLHTMVITYWFMSDPLGICTGVHDMCHAETYLRPPPGVKVPISTLNVDLPAVP